MQDDTPEITAVTEAGAQTVDVDFAQLAEWIGEGRAPITARLAEYVRPLLASAGLVSRRWMADALLMAQFVRDRGDRCP